MGLPADEGLPVFTRLLDDANAGARSMALYGLTQYGAAALPALAKVLDCYAEPHEDVAVRAAEVIGAMGPGASAAVTALSERLQSDGPRRVEVATVAALGGIGAGAGDALPVLERELTSPDAEIALAAWRAMGAIRNEPPLQDDRLAEGGAALFAGREGFRAFQGLQESRLPRERRLRLLHAVLRSPPPVPERIVAIEALGALGPSDPMSAKLLLEAIDAPQHAVAVAGGAALQRLSPTDPRTLDVLVAALSGKSERVMLGAAQAVARFGAAAAPAVPPVVRALRRSAGQTDHRLIGAYLDILRAVGPPAHAAVPVLTGMLAEHALVYQGRQSQPALAVRSYVLLTLADVGITVHAIPTIIDVLANEQSVRMIAAGARAAGALPDGQESVVPFLLRLLERGFADSVISLSPIETTFFVPQPLRTSGRLEVIRALERIGPPARGAVPLLRARAADPPIRSTFYPAYQGEAARVAAVLSR
jgi:HEAT repeat protein